MPRQTSMKVAKDDRQPYSLTNPPTSFTVSVDDTAEIDGSSKTTVHRKIAAGVYQVIRHGRHIRVLTAPLLAILRGERPPGGRPGATARPRKAAKKRPRKALRLKAKKPAPRAKPVKKVEAAPAAAEP